MLILVIQACTTRYEHLIGIGAAICLSLSFFGVIEVMYFIGSGGGHIMSGIIGSYADNNKIALALLSSVPMLIFSNLL